MVRISLPPDVPAGYDLHPRSVVLQAGIAQLFKHMFDSSLAQLSSTPTKRLFLNNHKPIPARLRKIKHSYTTIQAAKGTQIALKPVPDYNKLYPNFAIMKKNSG